MTMLTIGGRCWLCQQTLHRHQDGICSLCLRHLPSPPLCCPRCGLPSARNNIACGRCIQHPPPWNALVFVSDYQPPLSMLIKKLKFSGKPEVAALLARLLLIQWLSRYRAGEVYRPQHLISVPLHRKRMWARGYNQTDLLAQPLARWTRCDYHSSTLQRIRVTQPQQGLHAHQRKRNLRGAFRCQQNLTGCHVALLDDVVTTGSTVTEICKILLNQRVASIQIWCICRTL